MAPGAWLLATGGGFQKRGDDETMREALISEDYLRACLRDEYGLSAVTLALLPLGLDTAAAVYRAVSEQGTAYCIKARSRPLYEPSYLAPRYLADSGIATVAPPLPTRSGALWTSIVGQAGWMMALYPFIEGVSGWNPGMTDAQWRATGALVKRIHAAPPPPPEGFPSLRSEDFAVGEYTRWLARIEARIEAQDAGASRVERLLRERWLERRPTIRALLATLEAQAPALRARSGPRVICHADLHPSNLIRDGAGRVFLIDWDDVMLAPKERDFLFVGEPSAPDSAQAGGSPFFQGYGPVEVDWVALTYYRCERIVQDVIACAQDVYFRDDLGEDVKADAVDLFTRVVAPDNGMFRAALAAAAHLPANLALPAIVRAVLASG